MAGRVGSKVLNLLTVILTTTIVIHCKYEFVGALSMCHAVVNYQTAGDNHVVTILSLQYLHIKQLM